MAAATTVRPAPDESTRPRRASNALHSIAGARPGGGAGIRARARGGAFECNCFIVSTVDRAVYSSTYSEY